MFNLEKTAEKIINRTFQDHLSDLDKAKAQYGLSIILRMAIELVLAIFISLLFKTFFYMVIIMLSALSLRMVTGGAHCSSYPRCVVFTTAYFIPFSLLAKILHTGLIAQFLYIISGALLITVLPVLLKFKRYAVIVLPLIILVTSITAVAAGKTTAAGLLLAISLGLGLQAFILTSPGITLVTMADKLMKKAGV